MHEILKMKTKSVTPASPEYPARLTFIEKHKSHPLYYKGNLSLLDRENKIYAVIGTRNASNEGALAARELSSNLSKNGMIILNGLAVGIDTMALRAAEKAVAVMPCGLDMIYPESNLDLAEKIIENGGLLISEYEDGVQPQNFRFVERDRLQAALSDAVIVIEADLDSGTAQTVRWAGIYGRRIAAFSSETLHSKLCEDLLSRPSTIKITSPSDLNGILTRLDDNRQLTLFDSLNTTQ